MKLKLILLLLVFLPLIGCDRYTKELAIIVLKGQEPLSFLSGIFSIRYHENTGAMLSLGADLPDSLRFIIFTAIVGVILIAGLIYVMVKPMDKFNFTAGLLILAGGFGNLYDRVLNDGRVVDFMLVQFGPLRTGVFNVADIAIMAGLFGFVFLSSKWGKQLTRLSN